MALQGLLGAAGAAEGLKELLARRLQEHEFAEAQRRNLAQEGLQGRQLDETGALRGLTQQGLEQERLRDEAFRRDQLGQQKELSLAQLAQSRSTQEGVERRHREGLDLRRDLSGEANRRIVSLAQMRRMPKVDPAFFKWIQTLPSTDPDVQTATAKAMKFAPQDSDPQAIVQAVREAFGQTARPTAGERGDVTEAERFLLDELLGQLDDDLADNVIDRATYDQRRQQILDTLR